VDPLAAFTTPTRAWFEASFAAPTPAQAGGWKAISAGRHTLVHAPTGSGKTLAAFLWAVDRLLHDPLPPDAERCRVLYVSPLKALAHDVERNLRAPLAGIRHAAERMGGPPLPQLRTFLRTGDTPAEERRRMLRTPPDLLITTPESLFLILTSAARSVLNPVRWVIVDEVHAVAGTKRGAHLALSLERLEDLTERSPQRIGLSATQRPLEAIARFLGGGTAEGEVWTPRPVEIVDAPADRPLELELVVPVEDMTAAVAPDPLAAIAGEGSTARLVPGPGALPPARSGIWQAIYPRILDLIEAHRSTIVFANSRRLAERICAELNALAGTEVARAHHGSVAREQRIQIEEALKMGELRAVVATSSLELGIDMGAVDLVVQVEAPTSVASGLQRVGRAGHQVGGVSRAKIFPKYRGDLLVATVVADEMAAGRVEETRIPRNPLDVLAQQLVAAASLDAHTVDGLYELVRRAAPYADLTRAVFEATLDMLAGRYPSDLFAELRPRVTWDRTAGTVAARPGAQRIAIANAGTIPDRGLYRVSLADGSRVGELDEEMVYESREGDVFLLGSTAWRIVDIGVDRVEVVPEPGAPAPTLPFWHGDPAGRPLATGRAIGRFTREVGALDADHATRVLQERFRLDSLAAANLVAYLGEQRTATGLLPSDQTVVVERFRDEIGDWRLVVLSPFGARVHAPWGMAVTHKLRERFGADVDVIWSDDGIAFRFPDADEIPGAAEIVLDPEEVEPLLVEHLADTALFAGRFREAAGRSLLLPRRRPGDRTPLWLQRRRAADLLAVARGFGSFPIVLEVYREILQDDFDLAALQEVMGQIRARRIRVAEVETPRASPFAASLLFAFVAAYLYEGDAPLAERRAAALTLDRELLRELLGDAELRELLSPDVIAAVELELQHLTAERRVSSVDSVHDLLRRLGPLSLEELDLRSEGLDLPATLADLAAARRAIPVRVAGVERWAAIEDAGRLRDALGVQPPPGVPFAFLEPVADPLGDVVGRFARTHGPFHAGEAATALGLPRGVVDTALRRLEAEGRVVHGPFRPGGSEPEWVDAEVLRRLKRRSLAALRHEIEPVEAAALGRFLPAWQRAEEPARGRAALVETVRRLQGCALAASVLERDVLAARVEEAGGHLDQLMVEGELVWAGRGPLGMRDGRLALYLRRDLPRLWQPVTDPPPEGPLHDALRRHLEARGASFFLDLYRAAGGGDPQAVADALWDLVWAGEVTNDTLTPLRAYLRGPAARPPGRPVVAGSFPAHTAGRWSLVVHLLDPVEPTAAAAAWAAQLLDRHGVVTRSVVAAEGYPGGFSALYPVLSHLEESGRLRRGYFVEGLGGAQFALPGAVDRLRSAAEPPVVALAATDPANPYGAALPWPEAGDLRPSRQAGAYVVLAGGRLAAYLEKGGKRLARFEPDPDLNGVLARAVAAVAARHRRFTLQFVDGGPAAASPLAPALVEWGFATALHGLAYRHARR
jgi:ATP-dependent Lhr-like helicase